MSTLQNARLVTVGLTLSAMCVAFALGGHAEIATAQVATSAMSVESTNGATAAQATAAGQVAKKKAKKKYRWRRARVSWYGPGFYGNHMAGGGRLRRKSMVVAHRSLPFGTKVRIKYRGKTVTAVVKDRGPFVRGRTFDLGPGTAKKLGFRGVGTIKYTIVKKKHKKKSEGA